MLRLIGQTNRRAALRDYFKVGMIFVLLLFAWPKAPVFSRTTTNLPIVAHDAVSSPDPLFHDSVSRGITMVFNEQYEESLSIFRKLEQAYPNHPAPNFFKAAAYQNWMSNFRINNFQKELVENVQLAIDKGNTLLRQVNDDPWLHFYVGAAYGYRAFNRFRKQEWVGAYLDAQRGVDNLKKALAIEPNFYDVYLGLGSYYYWRTAKSKFLRIIAFWISDRRELGLQQLEISIDHGIYAKHEGSYALIAAYIDYGQYEKALNVYNRTIAKKKWHSVSDLYYQGRLLIHFQKWSEAKAIFQKILQRLENYKIASVGYQIEIKYWIALTLMTQNKVLEALRLAGEALAQSEKRSVDMELEGPFENFSEVNDNLLALHDLLKKKTKHMLAGNHGSFQAKAP
jgi:tetratricopeptide (TPR) repeat protein